MRSRRLYVVLVWSLATPGTMGDLGTQGVAQEIPWGMRDSRVITQDIPQGIPWRHVPGDLPRYPPGITQGIPQGLGFRRVWGSPWISARGSYTNQAQMKPTY